MMSDLMVRALTAAVTGAAQARAGRADAGTWRDVQPDVDARIDDVLARLGAEDIDAAARELGLSRPDRPAVEEAVRLRVHGLVEAALAA